MNTAHTNFNSKVVLFAVVGLLANHQLSAQLLQGTIGGIVTDTSRSAIVEAKITATNQETNFTRETTSNTVTGLARSPRWCQRTSRLVSRILFRLDESEDGGCGRASGIGYSLV